MKIVIDTSEQQPWSFSYPTIRKNLNTGDYSIEGHEELFCIERKSLDDYVRSITAEKDRFFKEILRMQSFSFACVLVEGEMTEITSHKYASPEVTPAQVIGLTASIMVHYGIPVFFSTDRQHAINFSETLMKLYYNSLAAPKAKSKKAPSTKKKPKNIL